jgi:putative FmdB family regulatory protein
MPTYTYACKQCDHRFDQRQSFDEPALAVCPECSGNLRKVLNSVGVVFKGSGFYRTDSRTSGKGSHTTPRPPADKSAASSTSTSRPASGESAKPVAKKEPAKQTTAAAA